MTTTDLVDMPADRLPVWLDTTMAEYVESRVRAGETRQQAEANKQRSLDQWFPDGAPLPDHRVWDLVDGDGAVVGYLWIGPFSPGSADWWVFDIEVDEPHRRRGHARRALEAAHRVARQEGATSIGLNVFGYNDGARDLYERLGYGVTALQMKLPLD